MPLTQTMRNLFAKFTTTEDSTSERFGSTSAWIHVGSSTSTTAVETANSLAGAAVMKAMDSGYPKRNDGTDSTAVNILAYRATYTTSEANFDWNEWLIKNTSATATGTGTALNKVVTAALGTKASTQAWQILAKITVST